MNRRLHLLARTVSGLLIALVTVAEADAQASKPAITRALANSHFKRGKALFADGNYPAALAEFEAAYQAIPDPDILNNVGLVQMQLFRYEEAIATLERVRPAMRRRPADLVRIDGAIRDMKALLAEVTFEMTPADASLVIDGRPAGRGPIAKVRLAAGLRRVEVEAAGYSAWKTEIQVAAGAPQFRKVDLDPLPSGKVPIATTPRGARVVIDGRPRGTTPLQLDLDPGGHTLELSKEGFLPVRGELSVAPGQEHARVHYRLERPPSWREPIHRRWWVWTLATVVAAGTAAAIAIPLASRDQEPIPGTLVPAAWEIN